MFFIYMFITAATNVIYRIASSTTRMLITSYIGIGSSSDIVLYIISMPFRMRRLYCDFSITNILIPTYKKHGVYSLLALFPWITCLTILTNIILHILTCSLSSDLLSYFFKSKNLYQFLYLFNILLPYMIFFVTTNMLNSFLEFKKHFFFTGINATIYYGGILLSLHAYQFSSDIAVNTIIYIILSGLIQLTATIIYFRYLEIPLYLTYAPFSEVKTNLYNIFKNNIGEYAIQMNILISTAIICTIPKSITYMVLTVTLYYIPITIFGKTIRTIILPILCTDKNPQKSFLTSSTYTFIISLLLTIICLYSSEYIIQYGVLWKNSYTPEDITHLTNNLFIFFIGLTPQTMSYIPLSYLYSRKIITPTIYIAVIISILNISLNYFTLEYFHYYTYAINFSIGYWLYTIMLYTTCYYYYDKKLPHELDEKTSN